VTTPLLPSWSPDSTEAETAEDISFSLRRVAVTTIPLLPATSA